MFSDHGGPGHEFADAVYRMTVGQLGQCIGQPSMRVDVGEFAVFNERGNHRPVVATFVGPCEKRVLAIEGQRSDASFDGVAVEINTTVIKEP